MNTIFNKAQIQEIKYGLKNGLTKEQIKIYADSKFSGEQMGQIRCGLENGVDVTVYAKPEFNAFQMYEICVGLEENLNVSFYINPKLTYNQMNEIRIYLERRKEAGLNGY